MSPRRARAARDVAVGAALLGAFVLAELLALRLTGLPLVGYDDANIFFVYARNLLDGEGLVYNPGGERVEGFTSPAWLLACAAAMALADRFEPLLLAACIVLIALAAWIVASFLGDLLASLGGRHPGRARWLAAALVALVIVQPGFVAWNGLSLMDSALWTAALAGCMACVLRACLGEPEASRARRILLPLLVLLAFVRPESMAWGPFLLGLSVGAARATGSRMAAAMRLHLPHAAALAAALGALLAFRLLYFGWPLPNTFYVKVSPDFGYRLRHGLLYAGEFLRDNPAYVVALALAPIVLATALRRRPPAATGDPRRGLAAVQSCLLLLLLAGAAVPVLEGGDHFSFSRAYQPAMLLVAVQAALLDVAFRGARRAGLLRAAAGGIVAVSLVAGLREWRKLDELEKMPHLAAPALEILIAHDMREMGRELSGIFAGGLPIVGVVVAGGFALGYDGVVFDLLGLNDIEMAHAPGRREGISGHAAFDADVFFRRAPDVVLLAAWSPARNGTGVPHSTICGVFDSPPEIEPGYAELRSRSVAPFDQIVLKRLLFDDRFRRVYAWSSVRPPGGSRWLHAPIRKDYLAELARRGFEIRVEAMPAAGGGSR